MKLLVILAVLAVISINVTFSRKLQKWSKYRATEKMCLSGDGSSYSGDVSRSETGKRCLHWNRFKHGLGCHNHCRNPDQSLMPWCYVRSGIGPVKEYCNIPKCTKPVVKHSPPALDTELTCGERSEQMIYKIVGGSFTPIESNPWVAAIFTKGGFLCGGSLISPCWVVSAAHCFSDRNADSLFVYLGKKAINETYADKEQTFTVDKLVIHENYNDSNYDNDIALLRIKSRDGKCALKTPSARVVCLPPQHTQLPAGFRCSTAGYGAKSFMGGFSKLLKQAEVNLISRKVCRKALHYGNSITRNMFCAGSPDWSADACKGDSGGPLVCELSGRMFLFGVVSWGDGCAKENKPGVYTQVSNYNRWIAASTGISEYTDGLMFPKKS